MSIKTHQHFNKFCFKCTKIYYKNLTPSIKGKFSCHLYSAAEEGGEPYAFKMHKMHCCILQTVN